MLEPQRRKKKKGSGRVRARESPASLGDSAIRTKGVADINGRYDGPASPSRASGHSRVVGWGSHPPPQSSVAQSAAPRPLQQSAFTAPDLSSSDDEFFSADESFENDSSPGILIPPSPPVRWRVRSPPIGTWTSSSARTAVRTYRPVPIDMTYPELPKLDHRMADARVSQTATQDSCADLGVSFDEVPTSDTAATSINPDWEEEYEEVPTDVDEEYDTAYITPDRSRDTGLPPSIDDENELEELRRSMEDSAMFHEPDPDDEAELSSAHRKIDPESFDALPLPKTAYDDEDYFGGDDFGLSESAMEELLQKEASIQHDRLPFDRFPYFVQYEVIRVSLAIGASISQCETRAPKVAERFFHPLCNAPSLAQFWRTMKRFARELAQDLGLFIFSHTMPPRLTESTWRALRHTKSWPVGFELVGQIQFKISDAELEEEDISVRLQPLNRRNMGSRFSARFGGDRFLYLRVDLSNVPACLSPDEAQCRHVQALVDQEISLVGRIWRCVSIKQEEKKVRVHGYTENQKYFVAVYFAEWGAGLGDASALRKQQLRLEPQPDTGDMNREFMSRDELISWAIPLEREFGYLRRESDVAKRGGTFAKLWARISLSFTPSRPTVQFTMDQISVVPDLKSPTGQVMTDGCAVCSPAVLQQVRGFLGLSETPTAIQGRLGGAKGVWFADPTELSKSLGNPDEMWITITPSMLKYQFHDEDRYPNTADWARLTLFVVDYSKPPSSAKLNSQLVPILTERKVPFGVLKEILEEQLDRDLDHLMQAARNRLILRAWLSGPGGGVRERVANDIRQHESGGLPLSTNEQLTMLLDAGFEPATCEFLMEKLSKMVETQCENVVDHIHISVPRSIYIYCIADPTGTLEEGEISLQFSRGFVDSASKSHENWLEGEVLVARNPAHLPTDIQKVTAVLSKHKGLNKLQDVVVFSTKGNRPLADLLSGGDYDGDKVWICWDNRIVDQFAPSKNSKFAYDENRFFETQPMPSDSFSDDVSSRDFYEKFFKQGFTISLRKSQLGYCTSILDKCMYALGRKLVMNGTILKLGMFCGTFVDAPKRGLVPTLETRNELTRLNNTYFERPKYKFPKGDRPAGDPENWFILDRLVFEVAKGKADEKMENFDKFRNSATDRADPHLSSVYHREWELSQNGKNKPLESILVRLQRDLRNLKEAWGRAMNPNLHGNDFDFEAECTAIARRYNEIMPLQSELCDPIIASWAHRAEEPFSHWKFLKASTAYFVCQSPPARGSKFAWWMTADFLCYIKSIETAKASDLLTPRMVSRDMYEILKPNSKVIQKYAADDEGSFDD